MPAFSEAQHDFVRRHLALATSDAMDLARLVTEPSGLSHEDMSTVIAHPELGERGLGVLCDLMKPEGSMYFDAIFGANRGQNAVRNWLLPTMQESAFLEFRPAGEGVFLDDGLGGTSVDEWAMYAAIGDTPMHMGNGISVRRYRDGWIEEAIDVYDTAPSRTPPPPELLAMLPEMPEQAPLPDYPVMQFEVVDVQHNPLSAAARSWVEARQAAHAAGGDHAHEAPSTLSNDDAHDLHNDPVAGMDPQLVADLMHPTDSVYIDPIFGRFEGQAAIRAWYTDIMSKMGNIQFESIAPVIWDGTTSLQMWRQYAHSEAGERVDMVWGYSLRRFESGWITYAADYFDTAGMADPKVQAAGIASGSTITLEDIVRYRGAAPGGAS